MQIPGLCPYYPVRGPWLGLLTLAGGNHISSQAAAGEYEPMCPPIQNGIHSERPVFLPTIRPMRLYKMPARKLIPDTQFRTRWYFGIFQSG